MIIRNNKSQILFNKEMSSNTCCMRHDVKFFCKILLMTYRLYYTYVYSKIYNKQIICNISNMLKNKNNLEFVRI